MKFLRVAFTLLTVTSHVAMAGNFNSSEEQVCETGSCSESDNNLNSLAGPEKETMGDTHNYAHVYAKVTASTLSLEWDEISPDQQQSLEARGYSKEEWDDEYEAELFWYHVLYWNELCEEKERHLTTLGWSQEIWDAKLYDHIVLYRPNSEVRPWSRLIPEEQEAAIALGFDSSSWHVRDWEGERSFEPVKFKFDLPDLLALNFDYLRTLDFETQTIPEAKPGQDDETYEEYVKMSMTEFVDALRDGRNLYMKYEDTEEGLFPKKIETTIKGALHDALENSPLKEVGQFGSEYDDIAKEDFASMYVGGANSTSHVHLDHQTFNFIYIIEGRKRVVLMPNDQSTVQQFPIVKETFWSAWPGVDILNGPLPEHAKEFILEKGEGIQIPYFGWHAVQNLEPCISYGFIRDWPHTAARKVIPEDYHE